MLRYYCLTITLLLSACGWPGYDAEPDESGVTAEITNYRVGNEPAPEGLIEGRLILDENCLLFENINGIQYNPVFGLGWSVDTDGPEPGLVVSERHISLGEQLLFSGGIPSDFSGLTDNQRRCASRVVILGELANE